MPYIADNRNNVDPTKHGAIGPANAGELNFAITRLCDEYISNHGLSYVTINEVVGVLECAKLELYRRVAVGHENHKIADNGDVYHNATDEL